ncbi:MAG: adenosylcobinamide-phosphate synthase CbiB [Halopseudomonas sp.]
MQSLLIIIGALLLDRWLGEPRRWHPLIGFGRLTQWLEGRLYPNDSNNTQQHRWRGVLAVLLLVAPLPGLLFYLLEQFPSSGFLAVIELLGLYLCLGRRSLIQHAEAIATPLARGDLDQARKRTGYIVSRDTESLDQAAMSRAAIESVLENGNDACFASLFWFLIGGLPLALLHRLANTLDAMWGYKSERYLHFGWAAARLDDLLGWLPARLTALSYALTGQTRNAFRCWKQQAPLHDSPNAGPVMAAGAGAVGVTIGGPAHYHGQLKPRPVFGSGDNANVAHIDRATALLNRSVGLWLALIAALLFVDYALNL